MSPLALLPFILALLTGFLSPVQAADAGRARSFRTFLPKPGAPSQEPQGQLIQLLLDRQEKEGQESYLIQVIFRGKVPTERVHRVMEDRVEIDFFDTGKPSLRPARIRGGALEATFLEELHYKDGQAVKRMVRLTLFIHGKPSLRLRNTLDRTLIHFLTPRGEGPSTTPPDSAHSSPSAPKSR